MTTAEIIEKLEAATGPDRELDAEIWFAICVPTDGRQARLGREEYGDRHIREHWTKGSIGIWDDELPAYTASLDAALTLVPEGADWDVGLISANGGFTSHVMWRAPAGGRFVEIGFDCSPETEINWMESAKAATPAVALCIAAIRAREASDA